jgi:hypothetical protein
MDRPGSIGWAESIVYFVICLLCAESRRSRRASRRLIVLQALIIIRPSLVFAHFDSFICPQTARESPEIGHRRPTNRAKPATNSDKSRGRTIAYRHSVKSNVHGSALG